jgi:hypothetical protein
MLNRLNQVSVAAWLPYFLSATLPDDVFDDDVASFAKKAKVWMDSFLKRLKRVCPSACGFWRIEWKARLTGKHVGKLFPHFHLLIWGLAERQLEDRYIINHHTGNIEGVEEVWESFVGMSDSQLTLELVSSLAACPKDLESKGNHWTRVEAGGGIGAFEFSGKRRFIDRCVNLVSLLTVEKVAPECSLAEKARNMCLVDWASLAWYHVVDSHNVDHLKAGVRVERVRTWGGVMSYCAKYLAKEDCNFLSDVQFGRSWGIFNRRSIPWAKIVELDLDTDTAVRLRRVARRYLERRFGRRVRSPYGITLYCDTENFRRLWEHAPPEDPF